MKTGFGATLGMCSYKVPQHPSTTWAAGLEVWITLYSRTFLLTIVLPYPTQYGLVSNIILCAGTGIGEVTLGSCQ